MKANDILKRAASILDERGQGYDNGQERSMERAVNVFNALTGHKISEEDGWKFMACLKLVRSENGLNADNYLDGAAYFALAGEAALSRQIELEYNPADAEFKRDFDTTPEEEEAWREAEKRMDAIGQNGPTGEHYRPDWVSEVLESHTLPPWVERLELTASGNVYVHGAGDKSARLCVLNKLALGMSYLAETWEV